MRSALVVAVLGLALLVPASSIADKPYTHFAISLEFHSSSELKVKSKGCDGGTDSTSIAEQITGTANLGRHSIGIQNQGGQKTSYKVEDRVLVTANQESCTTPKRPEAGSCTGVWAPEKDAAGLASVVPHGKRNYRVDVGWPLLVRQVKKDACSPAGGPAGATAPQFINTLVTTIGDVSKAQLDKALREGDPLVVTTDLTDGERQSEESAICADKSGCTPSFNATADVKLTPVR